MSSTITAKGYHAGMVDAMEGWGWAWIRRQIRIAERHGIEALRITRWGRVRGCVKSARAVWRHYQKIHPEMMGAGVHRPDRLRWRIVATIASFVATWRGTRPDRYRAAVFEAARRHGVGTDHLEGI